MFILKAVSLTMPSLKIFTLSKWKMCLVPSISKCICKYPIHSPKPNKTFLGLGKTFSYFHDIMQTNDQFQRIIYSSVLNKLDLMHRILCGINVHISAPSGSVWRPTQFFLSDFVYLNLAGKQIQLWYYFGGFCVILWCHLSPFHQDIQNWSTGPASTFLLSTYFQFTDNMISLLPN